MMLEILFKIASAHCDMRTYEILGLELTNLIKKSYFILMQKLNSITSKTYISDPDDALQGWRYGGPARNLALLLIGAPPLRKERLQDQLKFRSLPSKGTSKNYIDHSLF